MFGMYVMSDLIQSNPVLFEIQFAMQWLSP